MIIEWQRHLSEPEMRLKDAACQLTAKETAAILLHLINRNKIPIPTLSVALCVSTGVLTAWTQCRMKLKPSNRLFRRMVWMIYRMEAMKIRTINEYDLVTWGRLHPKKPLTFEWRGAAKTKSESLLDPLKPWVHTDWRKSDLQISAAMRCSMERVGRVRKELRGGFNEEALRIEFARAGSDPEFASGVYSARRRPGRHRQGAEQLEFESIEPATDIDLLIEKHNPGWIESQSKLDRDYLIAGRPLLVEL